MRIALFGLLGCSGGMDEASPVLTAEAIPAGRVLAEAPIEVRVSVRDTDTPADDLTVRVAGLDPIAAPAIVDGTVTFSLAPPVGSWEVTLTVSDPAGRSDALSFGFEAVDGDFDGDGAVSAEFDGGDCDDADAGVAPGVPEACDGRDQDCDGAVDEDPADGVTLYADADIDGFGGEISGATCAPTASDVAIGGDCDDANRFVHPGQTVIGQIGCEGLGAAFTWLGETAGDRAGDNVRDAGDLDGEGRSEVLIAAPEFEGAAGAVYLVAASAAGEAGLGSAQARLTGEAPGHGAGFDFISIGDLDGDGEGDLLIGAAGYDGVLGGEGAVYLALGPFAGDIPLGSAYARLVGSEAGDQLGDVAAGDLDGDGTTEIIVGARLADVGGLDAGWVAVLDALPPPGESRAADLATTRLIGELPGVIAGDPFPIGDLDADGLDDLAIATQEDATSGPHGGAVYIVLSPLPAGDVGLDEAYAKWIGDAGSLTGHAADGAGDLDADGKDDVVVGAPYADPNGSKSGAAYVVFGPGPVGVVSLTASADATLQGETAGIRAGFSVSRLGDMTRDGLLDLVIGAKFDSTVGLNAGAVYVAPGPFAGVVDLGVSGVKLLGEATGDLAGDVGAVADLDGDAIPDVLIGARHHSESGPDAGAAYVVFGAAF